jgi:hypothetical protein
VSITQRSLRLAEAKRDELALALVEHARELDRLYVAADDALTRWLATGRRLHHAAYLRARRSYDALVRKGTRRDG